jgi:hypothetical protein
MANKFAFLEDVASKLSLDPFNRAKIIASAVALVAVYKAPIPTTEVGSSQNHYRNQVATVVNDLLSQIGEGAVMDFKFAKELAQALWLVRYNSVYSPAFPFGCTEEGFFDQVFGVSRYVAKDAHCFLNENKACIFALALPLYNNIKNLEAAQNSADLSASGNSILMVSPVPSPAMISAEDESSTSLPSGQEAVKEADGTIPSTEQTAKTVDEFDTASPEMVSISQEGFAGGLVGFLVGSTGWVPFVGPAIQAAAKTKRLKLREDIQTIAKRIAQVRNGQIEEAKKNGTKLPKILKNIDYIEIIKSAILGQVFGGFYGAWQGSDLQNLNNQLQSKLKELEAELERAGISTEAFWESVPSALKPSLEDSDYSDPIDSNGPSLKETFEKVVDAYVENAPDEAEGLKNASGITEDEVKELETEGGRPVPESVSEILSISNGPAGDYGFFGDHDLMKSDDIAASLKEEVKVTSTDDRVDADSTDQWYPFAANENGDKLFVDESKDGQVVEVNGESGEATYVAPSMEAFYDQVSGLTLKSLKKRK